MSCPKQNKKYWLFGLIPYQPDCEWEVKSIGKFMKYVGNDFLVHYKCKYCGRPYERHFVTWDELLKAGIDNDYIEAAQHTRVYMDNEYQLNNIKSKNNG
jgi:hypothetical protein